MSEQTISRAIVIAALVQSSHHKCSTDYGDINSPLYEEAEQIMRWVNNPPVPQPSEQFQELIV